MKEDVLFPLTHCSREKKHYGKQSGSSSWMLKRASRRVTQSPALRDAKETFPSLGNSVVARDIYLNDLTQWSPFYFPITLSNSFLFLSSFSHSSINYYKALQDSVFAFCQWRKTSTAQIPISSQDFIHRQPFKRPCNIFVRRVLY